MKEIVNLIVLLYECMCKEEFQLKKYCSWNIDLEIINQFSAIKVNLGTIGIIGGMRK